VGGNIIEGYKVNHIRYQLSKGEIMIFIICDILLNINYHFGILLRHYIQSDQDFYWIFEQNHFCNNIIVFIGKHKLHN
jgi:hypothetical protein